MSSETPNKEHLDAFIESLRRRYAHEKLIEWPLDKLRGHEWLVRNEIERFKVTFPHKESVLQGEVRQFAFDDPSNDKSALTSMEKQRLSQVEKEVVSELNRAIGSREDDLWYKRNKYLESLLQFPLAILAILKEIKSWFKFK